MTRTKIEWTEHTWNPVTGCTSIAEGCQNCYARRMAQRLRGRYGYPEHEPFRVTLHPERLSEPLRWRKPRMVFVCSMGDLFHDDVPHGYIRKVFMTMLAHPKHTFQVLTKRPARMSLEIGAWRKKINASGNIWLGSSASTQADYDSAISVVRGLPGMRFLSLEPLLGPVDMRLFEFGLLSDYPGSVDWAIVGAETGPGARPMQLDWARSIRDQCQAAGVPFFFKRDSDGSRQLDGKTYEEYPNEG